MSIYTAGFWKDAGERAVWTFAQSLGALLTVDVLAGAGFFEVDWTAALSVALLATVYALIKALGAGAARPETGASTGTAIPKAEVAAVEVEREGEYVAEEASPFPTGTPVDVISDAQPHVGEEPDYPAEVDAGPEDPNAAR